MSSTKQNIVAEPCKPASASILAQLKTKFPVFCMPICIIMMVYFVDNVLFRISESGATSKVPANEKDADSSTNLLEVAAIIMCVLVPGLYFQYKHSKLDANGALTVAQMNAERKRLDKYLGNRHEEVWQHRHVVLVFVTNRGVVSSAGEEVAPGLLYIGHDQLSDHLGPELAGRGLVPTAIARREH